jgi:cytochrome P450
MALPDDPYRTYARLRQEGPLHRTGQGHWLVPRHRDVAKLLRSPGLGHQFPEAYYEEQLGVGAVREFLRRIMPFRDAPAHTHLRQAMRFAFGAASIARLKGRVGDIVDGLLAGVGDRGRFDVVEDLARHVPATVVSELVGLPESVREEIRLRVGALAKAFSSRISEAERAAADAAIGWMRDYLGKLLDEQAGLERSGLLSDLAARLRDNRSLNREELVDNLIFLFAAGFETTMHLVSGGCEALLHHPAEAARLRRDSALMPGAVEEFLRYDAPIQAAMRIAIEPVTIDACTVAEGSIVVLLLASANHDEDAFAEPWRLNIDRSPNPHVSFGSGMHYCLGAALARMEAATVFTRLLQRFQSLEPAGPTVRGQGSERGSFVSIPVLVSPG